MITADTITDAQIRKLRATSDYDELCTAALGGFVMDTRAKIHAARARCAEILNARGKATP